MLRCCSKTEKLRASSRINRNRLGVFRERFHFEFRCRNAGILRCSALLRGNFWRCSIFDFWRLDAPLMRWLTRGTRPPPWGGGGLGPSSFWTMMGSDLDFDFRMAGNGLESRRLVSSRVLERRLYARRVGPLCVLAGESTLPLTPCVLLLHLLGLDLLQLMTPIAAAPP